MVCYDLLLFMLKLETTTRATNSMPFYVFRRDHLRSTWGIICGAIWGIIFAVWGSFAVGNHLRCCTELFFALIFSLATISAFQQHFGTPWCAVLDLHSSLPIRFSTDRVFPLWCSLFVSPTLSLCSFFLVWKMRHVFPTYTVFWQAQVILLQRISAFHQGVPNICV